MPKRLLIIAALAMLATAVVSEAGSAQVGDVVGGDLGGTEVPLPGGSWFLMTTRRMNSGLTQTS